MERPLSIRLFTLIYSVTAVFAFTWLAADCMAMMQAAAGNQLLSKVAQANLAVGAVSFVLTLFLTGLIYFRGSLWARRFLALRWLASAALAFGVTRPAAMPTGVGSAAHVATAIAIAVVVIQGVTLACLFGEDAREWFGGDRTMWNG